MIFFLQTPEDAAIDVSIPIVSSDPFFDSTDTLYLEDLKDGKMKWECKNENLREQLFARTLTLLKKNIEQLDLPKEYNPLL